MKTLELRRRLEELSQIPSEDWMASLTPRNHEELNFHNKNREPSRSDELREYDTDTYERFYGNKKYYSATTRSRQYVENWLARMSPGAVVLDYACGNGEKALIAARSGADLVIGLDISDVSVKNAALAAEKEGLSGNTYFLQANAEATRLPDECIDAVICSGMLHHLDLSYAFPELRRILKVGGKILGVEALDLNPAIKMYRALTPEMRTDWEKAHILGPADLEFARRFFTVCDIRYWHVIGYLGGAVPSMLSLADRADQILEKIPLIQLMAWQWTFELVRPDKL